MQYLAWKDRFTKIAESKGVIQNTSKSATLEVSDSQTPNSGILLPPMSQLAFDGDIYVRCANGGGGTEARVVTFVATGTGNSGSGGSSGGSSSSGYDIATDQQIDELINTYFPIH